MRACARAGEREENPFAFGRRGRAKSESRRMLLWSQRVLIYSCRGIRVEAKEGKRQKGGKRGKKGEETAACIAVRGSESKEYLGESER